MKLVRLDKWNAYPMMDGVFFESALCTGRDSEGERHYCCMGLYCKDILNINDMDLLDAGVPSDLDPQPENVHVFTQRVTKEEIRDVLNKQNTNSTSIMLAFVLLSSKDTLEGHLAMINDSTHLTVRTKWNILNPLFKHYLGVELLLPHNT